MREIKFRLFNKHTKLYQVFTLSQLIKTTYRNSQFSFAGRYTGLKDKTGKEIYEGDRVKRRVTDFILEADHVDFNCDVVWNGWCYGLCVGGKQLWGLDPIVARECEIIGNIYEKPNI